MIDYKGQKFEDEAGEVDMVYDLIGGTTRARSWRLLKPSGRLVNTTHDGDVAAEAARHERRGVSYMAHPDSGQLRQIAQFADESRLQVMVERAFPLEDAAAAHVYLETGHPRGKVVLEVS